MELDQLTNRILALAKNQELTKHSLKAILDDSLNNRSRIADRSSWIKDTASLSELRRRIKIAHAKKSKSKNIEASLKKYDKEIRAGNERLDELLAEAGDNLQKLVEFGEETGRLLTKLINIEDERIRKMLGRYDLNIKIFNQLLSESSPSLSEEYKLRLQSIVPGDVMTIYKEKSDKGDKRVCSLNRKANLLSVLESKLPEELIDNLNK